MFWYQQSSKTEINRLTNPKRSKGCWWFLLNLQMDVKVFLMCLVYAFISAQKTNKKCHGTIKIASFTGEIMIIGMFPMRNEYQSEINNNALLWSEVFKYTIEQSNKQFNGRKIFGYIFYDMCGQEELDATTEATLDMLLGTDYFYAIQDSAMHCQCLKQNFPLAHTLGIIGPAISSNSIYVNKLVSFESIPQISYASTSAELTNTTTYPYFYRTIPSDTFQAMFVKDLLTNFNWTYISVIGTDNAYGRSGVNSLKNAIKDSDICIGVEALINVNKKHNNSKNAIEELYEETLSNVIVFWGSFDSLQSVLMEASIQKLKNKIWIVSEASGRNEWFTTDENKVDGTFLIINPMGGRNLEFEEYFYGLNLLDGYYNPWLETFFNVHGVNTTHNTNATLRQFSKYFDTAHVGFIQNAVLAYTKSYLNFALDNIPCDFTELDCTTTPIRNHSDFNEKYIQRIHFKGLHNDTVQFDHEGDITGAWYDLYMLIKNKNAPPVFTHVAHWSSEKGFHFLNDSLLEQAYEINSTCSDTCLPGTYAIYNAAKTCCWQCVSCENNFFKNNISLDECQACPEHYVSNPDHSSCIALEDIYLLFDSNAAFIMYIISAFGIIITTFFIGTFLYHRNTPIVRSSNTKLSLVQMFSHIVLCLSPLLFVHNDTKIKCIIRTYVTGFSFVLIVTITMVKTIHIVHIFKLTYRLTKWEVIQQKTTEVLIILLLMAVEISLATIMLTMKPMTIDITNDISQYKMFHECNSNDHYIVQVGYIILLQLICGTQAFRGRKLPAKYNEAKYNAFAMFTSTLVMIIAIPLKASISELNDTQLLLAIIIMVANFLILVIQYGYKIVLIWFFPEENTQKVFMQERIESCLSYTDRKLSKASTASLSVMNPNARYSLTPVIDSRETNLLPNVLRNKHAPGNNSTTSSRLSLPMNAIYEHDNAGYDSDESDVSSHKNKRKEKRNKVSDIYFENGFAICEL